MPHMPTYGEDGSGCTSEGCSTTRIISYTATGAEGTDFNVPIGATLAADTYNVGLLGTAGSANFPVLDFPNALAGDRTTTQFRVLSAATLTAGDILKFLLIEE
jgi:hypothetical protein